MLMRAIIVAAMLIMQPLAASAVSLGRVDVASHLDEAFFAEITLNLDKDESLSSIFVDLASPIEYRFLEVYRDQAIDNLRTAIKQDKRGLRVEITSSKALKSPYINLVLRVRHGRATHFKKFPIFLSLASIATPKMAQGKPVVTIAKTTAKSVNTTPQNPATKQEAFKPFSGWARTNRYGPMVYGDTLFTVARRLRTDKRYSVRQVAMALFNKNRDKFSQGNINLIKEGSYLDTPTFDEVEALSPSEASAAMIAQTKAWKKLKQQPKYARVAKAQKNRYSKRVRVGSQGEGVRHTATTPVAIAPSESQSEPQVLPVHTPAAPTAAPVAASKESVTAPTTSKATRSTEAQQRIAQLKSDNEILQATVTANNERLAELEKKLTASTAAASSDPKLKLLEARLMRIQRQLEQERANNRGDLLMWLIYAAAGIIVLLIVTIGVLMRRQPPHPAQLQQTPQSPPAPVAEAVTTAAPTSATTAETAATIDETAIATETATATEATEAPVTEEEDAADATTPDPDVDYLTEADVYLRYGMEEEAEAQVELALQLHPNDPASHAKLIEVREARGNMAEAEEAKQAALVLLTGSALATFETLLAPKAEQEVSPSDGAEEEHTEEEGTTEGHPTEEPSIENTSTEAPSTEVTASDSNDDNDLLASISTSDSENEINALLDIQDESPSYQDDDDELQNLLSSVEHSEGESEEEEDVLDLSMDSADDTDLDALISSLSATDHQDEDAITTESGSETDELIDSADLNQAPEPTPPSPSGDIDGDLAFDTSDLDLSQAKVEEPLINTASVDSDNDLDFDASGLDLSGIVLPSSNSEADTAAITTKSVTDEPKPEIADAIDLDLSNDEPAPPVTPAATADEASGSTLDISLDMDDLDALLASDETGSAKTEKPTTTEKKPAEAAPQSVDDELGSLLDGLDDLDLSGKQ